MAKIRHLARAPIREAIIDLQFQPQVSLEAVDRFAADVASNGDKVTDLWASTIELKVEAGGIRHAQTGSRIGKRIDLEDGKHVVQLHRSGVTFSRLPSYESWELISASAQQVWSRYFALVQPAEVVRIAVRFINALRVPMPLSDFDEYLTYAPQLPPDLPQSLSGFLNRVVINDQANGDFAVVTQMLEGETADRTGLNVLIDIDVSHPCQLATTDEQQITTILNRLRDTKNKAFFGFLEEKILEQYE